MSAKILSDSERLDYHLMRAKEDAARRGVSYCLAPEGTICYTCKRSPGSYMTGLAVWCRRGCYWMADETRRYRRGKRNKPRENKSKHKRGRRSRRR
jgi:hypothetical protein